MYNYTIIIPHKNTPNLLQRCLDSIPIREDLQIVIIDDNSDSSTVDFDNFPGKNRLHTDIFYTKESKGAGFARNEGLKKAKGKWILFADADDYFFSSINAFFEQNKDNETDIIFFNAKSESVSPNRTAHLNHFIDLYSTNQKKSEFLLRYAFGEPWCKMIKRNVIEKNKISFEETKIHNDTQFSYLVGFFSQSISIIKDKIYCVTNQPGSVSKKYSNEILFIRTKVFSKKQAFLQKNKISFYDPFLTSPFWDCYIKKKPVLFIKCLLIAKRNKASLFTIIKDLLKTRKKVKLGIQIEPYSS